MAQNTLLEAVERRCGDIHTSHWIEWLTDNGSCFIAKETLAFARDIGIINCFTPVRSPQSNGMAEAFVKTIKRDYAAISRLTDARSVMRQLPLWFEDYNEYAPHKGLKMLSPREFRREQEKLALMEISPGAAQADKKLPNKQAVKAACAAACCG